MFFDDHPEFLETSDTATSKGRLNMRHLGMIEANADVLRGRSVVDIASHDGRWSYAALEAGARSVIGVEGRMRMVKRARATFEGAGQGQYTAGTSLLAAGAVMVAFPVVVFYLFAQRHFIRGMVDGASKG